MNLELVDKIARAVLYEGYMLYPYRPSAVKNRQRWNFGVLYPRAYSESQIGSDAWSMQTECLIEGSMLATLEVRVKFLQMVARCVGRLASPIQELPSGEMLDFYPVEKLEVNGQFLQPWQEAVEREVSLPFCNLDDLDSEPVLQPFMFPAEKHCQAIRDETGKVAGVVIRQQEAIWGEIVATAERVGDDLLKVSVCIRNATPLAGCSLLSREEALLRSLVSTHTILGVQDARFVSSVDPPESLRELSAGCKNVGTWPVLVGGEGQRDTILSSPIILYDYPQIAPESSGDLFDGTEIDEILSLRIMTMTDEEKREMRHSDERARQILERTETLPAEHLMKLHGALRGLRPVKEEAR
jgi:hydrogenase maturation protease